MDIAFTFMNNYNFLNRINVRVLFPGLQEKQYDLFENLESYFTKIIQHYNIQPLKVQQPACGRMSAVIDVKTHDKRYIIKISALEDLESESFFLENAILHGIEVPEIYKTDFTKKVIPFDYMFLEFVEGVLPGEIHEDIRKNAGHILGKRLAKIHTIQSSGVGNIHKNCYAYKTEQWQTMFIESIRRTWKKIAFKEHAFTKDYQNTIESLLSRPILKQFQPSLLHGDFGGNNYLTKIDSEGTITSVSIIDPGTWVGGDPMQDLAFSQISWNYSGFSEGVMNGYVEIHPLSDAEQKRLAILKMYNQYWAAIISCQRDRVRWTEMLTVFRILLNQYEHHH